MQIKKIGIVQRVSLVTKISIFFVLTFLSGTLAMIHTLYYFHRNDLLDRSRSIINVLNAVMQVSNNVHGFWAENPGNMKVVEQVTAIDNNGKEKDLFLLHDPQINAAITHILGKNGKIDINLQLNNKTLPPKTEKYYFTKSKEDDAFVYLYAFPVNSRCVACHDKMPSAPKLQKDQVAGLIKIRFVHQGLYHLFGSSINVSMALIFLWGLFWAYILINLELIKPLTDLTNKVREMSLGNLDVDLNVKGVDEHKAGDEIVKLAVAIERLRRSQKTMEKMLDDDSLEL